jgi:polar amino acid transport system substrate-binding protein
VHIRGNGQKLEQVIINLIQNGCEALASPEAVLAVRVDRKNATCVISVRDEGQGISTLDIPKLTDPFFTTKRESGGTGLGLSVSAGIVKEHGGRLEFESEVDKGTIARVILPLKRNKKDAQ